MVSKLKSEKKTLTLGEKIEVIRRYEKGGVGARGLAHDFGVGKTQIQNIIKRKREHIPDYENNAPTSKRRNIRQTGNKGINQLCWEWFCDMRKRAVSVSGPMLQEQNLNFSKQLGVQDFKASNGWLDSFKRRHNIRGRILATCNTGLRDWERDATTMLEELQNEEKEESDEEEESEQGGTSHNKVPNLVSLVSLISDIKNLCAEEGLGELLDMFDQADDMLSKVWSQRRLTARQTKIDQFLKTK